VSVHRTATCITRLSPPWQQILCCFKFEGTNTFPLDTTDDAPQNHGVPETMATEDVNLPLSSLGYRTTTYTIRPRPCLVIKHKSVTACKA
jgi:hypothetical protein